MVLSKSSLRSFSVENRHNISGSATAAAPAQPGAKNPATLPLGGGDNDDVDVAFSTFFFLFFSRGPISEMVPEMARTTPAGV